MMASISRNLLRYGISFVLTVFLFSMIGVQHASAQTDTAGLEFTDIPTGPAANADSLFKADSVHKADSVAKVQTVVKTDTSTVEAPKTLWQLFIFGFVAGFAAFLLPCVYPMLPLTVSFFTKKGGTRAKAIWQSLLYGLSIITIYVVFGIIISLIFGPSALNDLATNGFFNMFMFLMLIVFGVSFLGAFEITLPSSLANKLDQSSDKGGFAGIFFMAATLVVVSFSCTGPAIGGVLANALLKGERLAPTIVMFGFSLAIALPFTIFAMFPSLLKSLPKSGGWLNSVKVILGLLEIALALKFLSNVDLAYHWNFVDREVVLSIWIALSAICSLYLIGKIRFSHDSPVEYLTTTRSFFAITSIAFTFYLIPGLWGAPLKAVSALLPPLSTQDFDISAGVSAPAVAPIQAVEGIGAKKYEKAFSRLPKVKGLDEWYDYDQAIALSKQLHKPVLIDFTGWNCVNCRQMEQNVFPNPAVLSRLQNNFVILQLVIDDKEVELPPSEHYTSRVSGKRITKLGAKLLDFEIEKFKSNSQPYYVIINEKGEKLVEPVGATPLDQFIAYLDSGVAAYTAQGK